MVPQYLREISEERKVRGERTTFSIRCGCGCELFDVWVNTQTPEEKARMDAYRKEYERVYQGSYARMYTVDDMGGGHWWKFVFPGIKIEVFPPEMPSFATVTCWKLRCSGCGKEHLIFDNRLHGYDGVFCSENADRAYQPRFQQRKFRDGQPRRIEITTENDKTIADFREATGTDCDHDTYSNAFGWIGVYTVDSKGKRTKILDAETA